MSDMPITAAQRAQFDQLWAEVNERLDGLISTYQFCVQADPACYEANVGSMVRSLHDHARPEVMAELLTAAVLRLVQQNGDM